MSRNDYYQEQGIPDLPHAAIADALGLTEPAVRSLLWRGFDRRQALAATEQAAAIDATVLLFGESGTGKELLRAIHELSPCIEAPLIKVNCAAIPAELVESGFFGHEKGAFTGATARREGRFGMAHGGAILLHEIGDLPLALPTEIEKRVSAIFRASAPISRTACVDTNVSLTDI